MLYIMFYSYVARSKTHRITDLTYPTVGVALLRSNMLDRLRSSFEPLPVSMIFSREYKVYGLLTAHTNRFGALRKPHPKFSASGEMLELFV